MRADVPFARLFLDAMPGEPPSRPTTAAGRCAAACAEIADPPPTAAAEALVLPVGSGATRPARWWWG